jgi:hypothetical protein
MYTIMFLVLSHFYFFRTLIFFLYFYCPKNYLSWIKAFFYSLLLPFSTHTFLRWSKDIYVSLASQSGFARITSNSLVHYLTCYLPPKIFSFTFLVCISANPPYFSHQRQGQETEDHPGSLFPGPLFWKVRQHSFSLCPCYLSSHLRLHLQHFWLEFSKHGS